MLGWILLIAAVLGFGYAGYLDLKYTEFPDYIPYALILFSLASRGIYSFLTKDVSYFLNSVVIGIIFLATGLLVYYTKQWGDGDAWLLGAMGFMFPDSAGLISESFPFYLTLLFNLLIVSLVYLILYSIALGIKNKKIWKIFVKDLKDKKNKIIFIIALFFIFSWAPLIYIIIEFNLTFYDVVPMLFLPFFISVIFIFSEYAIVVEKNLFRKKIKSENLKEGDVLIKDRWKGLSREEVEKIKKTKKYVWIKEGVRLAPVFLITVLISVFFGNLMILFF